MVIVRVHHHLTGRIIADITRPSNLNHSKLLRKVGQLTFDISIRDPKSTSDVLRKDNIVAVYSTDLPTWYGIITVLVWSETVVSVTRQSIEYRLSRRRTQKHSVEDYPGKIIARLVNTANKSAATGITLGSIEPGTTKIKLDFNVDNVLQRIDDVVDLTKMEYAIRCMDALINPYSNILSTWEMSLRAKQGQNLFNKVTLIYGIDINAAPDYQEDNSNFANTLYATAQALGGSDTVAVTYADAASVRLDGLSEDSYSYNLAGSARSLRTRTIAEVNRRKNVNTTLSIVRNRYRKVWGTFDTGDVIQVIIPGYRFTGLAVPFRVEGIETDEDTQQLTIAGHILTSDEIRFYGIPTSKIFNGGRA